ncbi:hypothetical protein [Escherichia coli]|uniref:F4 family fimbrial subunit n=1 Tax=Escherichia coli TaxID=562 RepID=UPI001C467CB6|nr:hypothetical protein [Escherichia coli]MCE0533850.1 hypothetical protein [Escherichia coli]MCE0553028.1 hypothetical protein [Escherichia coli]QXN18736.1 hypothetical protein KW063_00345 [Escherichia coli]
MKKTLIALAVTASTVVSGSAMAWTEGEFNHNIEFGGNIQQETVTWKWNVPDDTVFKNIDVDKKSGSDDGVGTDFSGLFTDNVSLLVGKTTGISSLPATGLSPTINFNADQVSNLGSDPLTKGMRLVVSNEDGRKIGYFFFDFYAFGLVVGDDNRDSQRHYAGVADPAQTFGNGYYKYTTQYNNITSDGFKTGIEHALGVDAPDMTSASAASNIENVNVFSNASSPYSNISGAYAAVIKAGSGKLRIYNERLSSRTWSASLPVVISYQ